MKTKKNRTHRYRGNKQTGDAITITAVVPREVARVINAEGLLRDRSVSNVVAEILISRYFEGGNLKARKPLV